MKPVARNCAWALCGRTFTTRAVNTRYCCPSHRQYAYLARKAARQGLPVSPTGYVRLAALRGTGAYWAGGWWPALRD